MPSCRHTHPAADALLQLMTEHRIAADAVRKVDGPGPPGRDRRARPGHRSADRAPGQILDGHGARPDRDAGPRRPRPNSTPVFAIRRSIAFRDKVEMVRDGEVDARLPGALDRQGRGRDHRRPHASPRASTSRRATPATRLSRDRDRGQGAAPGALPRWRERGRDAQRDRTRLGAGRRAGRPALAGLTR